MKTGLIVTAYAVGAFLTFGHVFNDNYVEPKSTIECGAKPNILDDETGWSAWYDCIHPPFSASKFGAAFPAVYAGLLWPAYWGAVGAIEVTK